VAAIPPASRETRYRSVVTWTGEIRVPPLGAEAGCFAAHGFTASLAIATGAFPLQVWTPMLSTFEISAGRTTGGRPSYQACA
jgi:hypothetical protein